MFCNFSSTARLLLASREAESALAEALRRDISEIDFGNHSDSEDSLTSHRSFLSETFSPPSSARHHFIEVCFLESQNAQRSPHIHANL